MFARCSVTLSMPYPVDGMVAVHLFKGTLLRPVHPGYPWFCLVEEVKLGLSGTHITDAECVDFGANGNIPALTLVEVAGYPGIRVTNSRAAGGQDAPYGVLDSVQVPSRESAALAVVSKDPRIALGDRTDIATLIRMNIPQLENMVGPEQARVLYEAAQRPKPYDHNETQILLGDIYGTVARVVITNSRWPHLPPIAMGFHQTRLVYFAVGQGPAFNKLPGEARLLLPSESARLLSG